VLEQQYLKKKQKTKKQKNKKTKEKSYRTRGSASRFTKTSLQPTFHSFSVVLSSLGCTMSRQPPQLREEHKEFKGRNTTRTEQINISSTEVVFLISP